MLRMNHYRRPAIGLVELMVAMALTIGIMWILAEAFKTGLDMTRELRSTTAMVSNLDGAKAIIAYDLSKDHFPRDDNRPGGGTKLSQQRFDWLTSAGTGWSPPNAGFFRIISPAPSGFQPPDADGFSMNTLTQCALHFTSLLPVGERNLYTVKIGNNVYTSRAAEIAYFLVESGQSTSASGPPMYKLHRRMRLVAVSNDERSQLIGGVTDPEVIAGNGVDRVYTLADIRDPALRLRIDPSTFPELIKNPPVFGLGHPRQGEDLLLSNVLSFEVQVDWSPHTAGTPTIPGDDFLGSNLAPRTTAVGNWDWPFDSLHYPGGNAGHNTINGAGGVSGVFDTWIGAPTNMTWSTGLNVPGQTAQKLPLAIRVKQLKIILRIFDNKTQQTRQSTLLQDM